MPLIDNLVSYWKMDETSGNAIDAHTGGNNLTDNNSVGSGTGVINGSRAFDVASFRYLSHTNNTSLQVGDIDFTFNLWVKFTSTPGTVGQALVCKGTSPSTYEYDLYTSGSLNRFQWYVEDSSGGSANVIANNFGAITAGQFNMVTCWHDSFNNQIGIAINGGAPNTAAFTTGVRSSTGDLNIGRDGVAAGVYFTGSIDELGFWKNRVLLAADINQLYNGGTGSAYPFTGGAAPGPTIILMGQTWT